jgi:hypothetical protein
MSYKIIFKNILDNKYKIKKVSNNILNIIYDKKTVKCKYFLLLTEKYISNDISLIIWADANPYIDKITVTIANNTRKILISDKKYLLNNNNQLIQKNDFTDLINTLIKNNYKIKLDYDDQKDNQDQSYTCIWIISNNVSSDYNEIYMITELITF